MSWYYSEKLKPVGPVDLKLIVDKIERGEIGPYDLLMKNDDTWREASSFPEFKFNLFPAWQMWSRAKISAEESTDAKWVLLIKHDQEVKQEGPVSTSDVYARINRKDLPFAETWIWQNGMTGWARIADRPEFREAILPNL